MTKQQQNLPGIKKQKKEISKIVFRCDPQTYQLIETAAKFDIRSINTWILMACREKLQRDGYYSKDKK